MSWFESHAYVAAWLSPVITLISLGFQNNLPRTTKVDWSRVIFYTAYLTILAVAVSPGYDLAAQTTARGLAITGFVWLFFDMRSR